MEKYLDKIPTWAWYLAAAGVVLYVIKKGSVGAAVEGATAALVSGTIDTAGNVANGVVTGAVTSIGSVVGIPLTDNQKCRACVNAGNNWDGSKYCTAEQFARWQWLSFQQKVFGKKFSADQVIYGGQ